MNNRAIELYKESAEFAYKICKDEGRTGGPGDHIWDMLSTGKFAELIITECVKICLDQRKPGNLNYDPGKKCADAIRDHFGVNQ